MVLKVAAKTDPHKLAAAIVHSTATEDAQMVAVGREAILTATEALAITSERGHSVWAKVSFSHLETGRNGAAFHLIQDAIQSHEETPGNGNSDG